MCGRPDEELEFDVTQKIKEGFYLYVQMTSQCLTEDEIKELTVSSAIEDFSIDVSNVLQKELKNKKMLSEFKGWKNEEV